MTIGGAARISPASGSPSDVESPAPPFDRHVAILGGCGHVGLPLGIAFADQGLQVALYDTDRAAVDLVNRGGLPFLEEGADEALGRVRESGRLVASADDVVVGSAENVVVVIGTPVDEHLNPDPEGVPRAIGELQHRLVDGQLIVLRSTIYPGVTAMVERLVRRLGLDVDVAFCPERIAEGRAMTELGSLPQIVAGRTDQSVKRAASLFQHLTDLIVELNPEEAELAKLFTNTWRYIKFAAANQLFMIANDFGVDFERVRHAVTWEYPRAADMPSAGFAAGPCLLKDTMQVAAFNNNNFTLGNSSMLINEGLPLYAVARLEQRFDLPSLTVGILGMAFKANSGDTRSSLSYKLKRILKFKAGDVVCTDPYVTTDPELLPMEEVLERADVLVIATPHACYGSIVTDKPTVDIFNLLGRGVRV
jgi:UDP-N-acetyl-D-mannosaminuronic acid dehydrogenase